MCEYSEWFTSYHNYLKQLYEGVFLRYLTRKEKKEIPFEKFCRFVYENSSGEIVDYL